MSEKKVIKAQGFFKVLASLLMVCQRKRLKTPALQCLMSVL